VALLSVQGEPALMYLISQLEAEGIRHVAFKEPDIGNQITSVCIEPSEKTRTICAGIPLALKEFRSEKVIDKHTYVKELVKRQNIKPIQHEVD
jgi:hypothetical protein